MIIGLSIQVFTILHVIISLIGIVSGLVVLAGLLTNDLRVGWTALFLAATVLTSVTGFLFPIHGFTPALGTGVISLIILTIALVALYGKHLMGDWRWIYVVTAIAALYLNVFVLIVQSFQKVPFLHALAPTQTNEPPFLIAQAASLILFVVAGALAVFRFRPHIGAV